jgi:geranylgeranyl reductase family protein
MESSLPQASVYDVAIAGSGPAGSTAAWQLAQRGARVIILEKAAIPRYKTCGGGVVRRAFRWLPRDLDGVVRQYCYTAEVHHLDYDLHFSVTRTQPIVAMTMRNEFDEFLLRHACSAGATLLTHCMVVAVAQSNKCVRIETPNGEFKARFLIAADGATGTVARKAGWQETRPLIPALEYEVFLPKSSASDEPLARFDFGVVESGYGWVFPKRDHLSIGILSLLPHSVNLNLAIVRYMKELGLQQPSRIERHGFVIPWRPRQDGFVRNRILLVGDAAGFVDPVTGEGISYALLSGRLAAEAILDGQFEPARVSTLFTRSIRKSILSELLLGVLLSKVLYNAQLRRYVFAKFGQTLCEAMVQVMSGDLTYWSLLLKPKTYTYLLFGRN